MPPQHPHTPQLRDQRGQTLSEYAILVGAIAVFVAVAIPLLGTSVFGIFSTIANAFPG